MISRPRTCVFVLALALAGWGLDAYAEVSAETDAFGNYVRTLVFVNASARQPRIWSALRVRPLLHPLNAAGDRNGDLWPEIAENPVDGNRPWVVWSRFDGLEYRLASSRWDSDGWTPIDWVEAQGARGDDLDPEVVFNSQGRPHAAWWRNANGVGEVYLTLFLVSHWMDAVLVSDIGVDSRYPTVTILDDGHIRVEYDTPDGRVARIVSFNRPLTITDDLDPVGRLQVGPENPAGASDSPARR